MNNQKLIASEYVFKKLFEMISCYKKDKKVDEVAVLLQVGDMIVSCPEINPETLPIVKELRNQLEQITKERDAAIKDIENILVLAYDSPCRVCIQYDSSEMQGHSLRWCSENAKWRGVQEKND